MSRYGTVASILLSVLVALTFASLPAAADAAVPTHDVGDKVGLGATTDIGALADPYITLLKLIDNQDDNFTINELTVTGSSDIWATMEVVGETADTYTIQTETANGLKLQYVLNVTSPLFPQEGTYTGDMSQGYCAPPTSFDMTTKTLFADVDIQYLEASIGVALWNVSDFALQQDETNTTVEFRTTATYRDFPSYAIDLAACTITIAYESGEETTTADIALDMKSVYTPALDLFDFPIQSGEVWDVNSTVTQGGRIQGTLDVTGLDPQEEQAFFDDINQTLAMLGFSVSGLDGFPIVFEDVTIMLRNDPYLKDGVIREFDSPVNLALTAQESQKTLADEQDHTVYLISMSTGSPYGAPCSWVYSPDDGFVVGFQCAYGTTTFFELPNVPPDTAEQHIEQTKDTYSLSGSIGADFLGTFFLKPPFFGVLLIVAVAVLVAALLVRRRRKPVLAPPGAMPPMPPQAPPPGPP